MTKKEQEAMRLAILKERGKRGLREFNNLNRVTGRMKTVQVHSNAAYDAQKGYRRHPKHRAAE